MYRKHEIGIPSNMGMDHIGLVVPNAQKAAEFLMDVFDAEFDWEIRREPRPNAKERGWDKTFDVEPEAYLAHVIMLHCGDDTLSQYIELFEWQSTQLSPKLQGEGGWHRFCDHANSYISFTVKDILSVMAHIKEKVIPHYPGVRFIQDPPMVFPLRGEECTSTFLVSPWGMWIELTQWSESRDKKQLIRAKRTQDDPPYKGLPMESLPTPAFCIDLDVVAHNASLMAKRCAEKGVSWRIPVKAHKCPQLAKFILQFGAQGIVVLTLAEAKAFAKAGIDDIYLANQLCQQEIGQIALLAKTVKRLRVAIDNKHYLTALAQCVEKYEVTTPVDILIELNINHNRCGTTAEGAVEIAKLAKSIEQTTGAVRLVGITGYEGHTPLMEPEEKLDETQSAHQLLKRTSELLLDNDIEIEVISAGGSCNYLDCLEAGVINEVQAGGGAVGDLLYCKKAGLEKYGHQIGALIVAEVISVPEDGSRAIANAGFKSLGWHPFAGYPRVLGRDDLEVFGLSAEHVRMHATKNIRRGDKLIFQSAYTDAMGFMHKKIYAVQKGMVEDVWPTV